MTVLLIIANVIGFLALAGACLKCLETGPTIGPAFSPAARVVILAIVFMALYSAIEALAWNRELRPGSTFLVFVLGLFALWRTCAPAWASFLQRPGLFHQGMRPHR